ncbi:tetratricopeptide repeat protein [Prosthecobacter sp.]|uniref:tetratricopeptide repeat protein n=1 Tax=Prosthecobacter sp. TaxID=1965333 RepID=UPI003783C07D
MHFRKNIDVKIALLAAQLLLPLAGAGAADRNLESRLMSLPSLTPGAKPPKVSFFARGLQALEGKDYAAALEYFDKAVASTGIKSTPLSWLTAQYQVCQTLNLLGRKPEAVTRARQMVETCESALGAEDPITSEALAYLAFLLQRNGRLMEAEPVYARNLAGLVDKHGGDSFFAACARTRLANLLMQLGRMEEAENHHRQALAAAQTALGHEHADNCFFLTHLGYCLHVKQKKPEAETLMNKAFSIVQASNVLEMPNGSSILRRQAEFFRDIKQLDKARVAGRLCLERLAGRAETNRARFFFYDQVKELYHSILAADGLKPHEIKTHVAEVETRARGDR